MARSQQELNDLVDSFNGRPKGTTNGSTGGSSSGGGSSSSSTSADVQKFLDWHYSLTDEQKRAFGDEVSRRDSEGRASKAERVNFDQRAKALFGYLPAPLLKVFMSAYDDNGDAELALAEMRKSTTYDQYYAGNRRADGTVRNSEAEYTSIVEGYNRRRAMYGMSPITAERQRQLIEGEKSPDEFGAQLDRAYVELVGNISNVREYYATTYGATNLSDSALLESYTDPTVSPMEAERRLATAKIGGEAGLRGFTLAKTEAERLQTFGLDQQAARSLFGQAQSELPKLNDLVGRFNDPDDPMTIEDFADAVVLSDADQAQRIGRLYGQQASLYSGQDLFQRSEGGALSGLLDR